MSDTPETTEEQQPHKLEEITLADVAALAMAIAIWLGNQNPTALDEIGNMADDLKESLVERE